METKNLIGEMSMLDILQPVQGNFSKFGWTFDEEGRIVYTTHPAVNNGWNIVVPSNDRKCIRWLHTFFSYYNLIPKPCFGCFKVVSFPRNFDELMRFVDIQSRLGFPAKCGIEQRGYVERNYGAYWYAPLGRGLKSARNLLNEVKKAVEDEFGEDHPKTILKRGCTEMERSWGPSNLWKYTAQEEFLYKLLEQSYAEVPGLEADPTAKKPFTIKQWIMFASSIGDETYKKYTPGLATPPMDYTYQNHGVEEDDIEVVGD